MLVQEAISLSSIINQVECYLGNYLWSQTVRNWWCSILIYFFVIFHGFIGSRIVLFVDDMKGFIVLNQN